MTDVEVTENVTIHSTRNYTLTPISDDNSKFTGLIEDDKVTVSYSSIEGSSSITVPISQARNAKAFIAMLEADLAAREDTPPAEPDIPEEEEPVDPPQEP